MTEPMHYAAPSTLYRGELRSFILAGVFLLLLCAKPLHACEPAVPGVRVCPEAVRDFVYHGFKTPNISELFWRFDAAQITDDDKRQFNQWYATSKFKDVSPKIGNAYFMKGSVQQRILLNAAGQLEFTRGPGDRFAHTMLELSVNNVAGAGAFVNYDGYRSMRPGVPYEIELELKVLGDTWWRDVPWAVLFQGHAIPDFVDKGAKFNPPFALVVTRGRWQVHLRADSRMKLPRDRKYQRNEQIDLGAVKADEWVRVLLRVSWGDDSRTGALPGGMAVFMDDRLKHREWGARNFYNNRSHLMEKLGPYLTFGAYLPVAETRARNVNVMFRKIEVRTGPW